MDRLAIDFAPLFAWSVLVPLAAAALLFAGFGLARRARGTVWRACSLAVLWIGLANPVLVEEERERLPDVAAVVVDDSPSQRVAGRRERTEAALEHLQAGLARLSDLQVKVVRAGAASGSGAAGPVDGVELRTRATFSRPGAYVLRAAVSDGDTNPGGWPRVPATTFASVTIDVRAE